MCYGKEAKINLDNEIKKVDCATNIDLWCPRCSFVVDRSFGFVPMLVLVKWRRRRVLCCYFGHLRWSRLWRRSSQNVFLGIFLLVQSLVLKCKESNEMTKIQLLQWNCDKKNDNICILVFIEITFVLWAGRGGPEWGVSSWGFGCWRGVVSNTLLLYMCWLCCSGLSFVMGPSGLVLFFVTWDVSCM